MRICGVIAEYNPFHLGHAYHLQRAREMSGCDYLIVTMSGSFVQRGEPAVVNKWIRAGCALRHGADLVVELPARFAVRSADAFAKGGVGILVGLGAEVLCFGAESPLDTLQSAAKALEEETDTMSAAIREGLDRGETLARARGEALSKLLGVDRSLFMYPNNALAMEYLRAGMRLPHAMGMLAVERRGEYHALTLSQDTGSFASASALRTALRAGDYEGASRHMPHDCAAAISDPAGITRPEALDDLLLYILRDTKPEELSRLCDAGEGVERRLCKAARIASSRADVIETAKCKRYTYARLSRLCAQALLRLERREREYPAYARVLGFRKEAAPLLRCLQDTARIPLCADAAALKDDPDFRLDARSTDLFGLCCAQGDLRKADSDYRRPPVIL